MSVYIIETMKRINIYISENDLKELERTPDTTVSEQIRYAVREYIKQLRKFKVIISPSKYGKK